MPLTAYRLGSTTTREAGVAQTETAHGWLREEEMADVRERVPIVYVEAVPVRVDHLGRIERVGLLLRQRPDGTISRALVSGRVLYGETLREALWRNLSKDLGPESLPQLPPEPAPFTVAEYFPDDGLRSGFTDPRQHAVSLAYVVPVSGECAPAQDTLDLAWLSPDEALSPAVAAEMSGGQDRLVRLALAYAGLLP
jgi:ADP-ribose pyrophosphatase YjhB (NUDIX family)